MTEKEQTIFGHIGNKVNTEDREIDIIARLDDPLIVLLGNVLSNDECDELIHLSQGRLNCSKVGAMHQLNDIRTSSGMFFQDGESDLVARIETRTSQIMNVPIAHGENLQILHYEPGQEYKPHFDFFLSPSVKNNRISTLVIYLNDVELGGETLFPKVNFSVSPRKGNAVYFEYFYNDPELNDRTLHAGTPVVLGEKWVATQWMRRQQYRESGANSRGYGWTPIDSAMQTHDHNWG